MRALALAAACALAAAGAARAQGSPAGDRVVLHTTLGDIVVAVYPEAAPRHAEQFLLLAKLKAYDSTPVHWIKPGYLIQFAAAGGRRLPLSREQRSALRRLPLEAGALKHTRGALSMARDPKDPGSAESSFSILLRDAPHLDGKFTAFGRVERGWETLEALAATPRLSTNQPVHWLEITRAQAVPVAQLEGNLEKWKQPGARRAPSSVLVWLLAALFVSASAAALLEGRFYARVTRAACLLNALLGFFALLVALMPTLPLKGSWVATALFVGALVLFRLLATFEPPKA